MDKFDRETLEVLDEAEEVRVETGGGGSPGAVIWAVVVDDTVFVRSVRGEKGRWYREASANREAALRVDDRRILVRAVPETDAATIEKVSAAYRDKYGASYPGPTAAMLREEVLPTTLRLLPA
ncbi:DUF2255 family protein [Rubrobacter tropicus]|uniref:DUF2255 family protein n=1 Tax=Rubrobacter tropicus TaxID=2653851 RepID=A0A6G8Q4W1_9ACTN|nr:DUF2255 family protein [Rubrobacter tropicus]QIN81534.1 DUF2255 family protein [Rubrobacter tropicus]